MQDGNIITLDTLLAAIATIASVLVAIYIVLTFVATLRRHGLHLAVIRLFSFRVLGPVLLVIGLYLLSAALVFVHPQHVAVIVSVVSPGGVRAEALRAGLHLIIPILEREVIYPIYWQTYTMSGKPTEGAQLGDDSIRARTSDGQEVRLDCSLIFRIDAEQAVVVHIDWQNRYVADLIRPVVRGLVRTHVSQFTVREVNSSARKDLEATVDRTLRQGFAAKGFILDQFLLRDITFTPEYAAAIEHKQIAFEGEEQKLHEADQIRNLARGRADAIEIEAQAKARAIELFAEALKRNPNVLTYQYVEKLSPNIRVMLVPNNAPLMLPLPYIDEQEAANPLPSPHGSADGATSPRQPQDRQSGTTWKDQFTTRPEGGPAPQ
jgi:regulator of protease activity HflC (stomatin/prohibitin superfamily)